MRKQTANRARSPDSSDWAESMYSMNFWVKEEIMLFLVEISGQFMGILGIDATPGIKFRCRYQIFEKSNQ